MNRRVVVTGVGAITPLGINVQSTWERLIDGQSGIAAIPETYFQTSDLATRIGGFISTDPSKEGAFIASNYLSDSEVRRNDKFIHYGIAAAIEAINQAGIADLDNKERIGVLIGSGIGGFKTIEDTAIILKEQGPRRISPFFIPSILINLISGNISIKYGFKGPNHSVVTACSTGTHAIGDAYRMIMLDDADVMVAGGAEAALNRLGIAGFNACRALSTKYNDTPSTASRPWDKGRDGFVMGEGSGIVVLEEYEHAKRRGAEMIAEVIGYGMSGDAHHITAPPEDGNGAFRAMQAALKSARTNPELIDYINAHGTSTPLGDVIEYNAVKRLFNDDLSNVAMSSTKSSIGHLLGAAGAVEAIFTALALKTSILPPTLNLHDVEDGISMNLVANKAQEKKCNFAISNSFGFGGTNASLVFKKID